MDGGRRPNLDHATSPKKKILFTSLEYLSPGHGLFERFISSLQKRVRQDESLDFNGASCSKGEVVCPVSELELLLLLGQRVSRRWREGDE